MFENFRKAPESANPAELIKSKLTELHAEADRLNKLIAESGENTDAELGSEQYVDFGYTEQLNEVNTEIAAQEKALRDLDDAAAAQRSLGL
jgi:hypothetical protein